MNNSNINIRQVLANGRDILLIDNALVEEVLVNSKGIGHLIVSYRVNNDFGNRRDSTEFLKLIVGRNTQISDYNGNSLNLWNIRPGRYIDAEFSSTMTRSIPPQANAFKIIVGHEDFITDMGVRVVSTGRIVQVDPINHYFIMGSSRNASDRVRFNVTDKTVYLDRKGNRINLGALRIGQNARVTHAGFQTMSIPPQTTAFLVQLI